MEKNQIAAKNHLFYSIAVGLLFGTTDFGRAVIRSLVEKTQYSTEATTIPGYILIDSTEIEDMHPRRDLMDAVENGLLQSLSYDIYNSVTGEMNTNVDLVKDGYKFKFRITKHERGQEHGFEPLGDIKDFEEVADDEKIGYFCELTVTLE